MRLSSETHPRNMVLSGLWVSRGVLSCCNEREESSLRPPPKQIRGGVKMQDLRELVAEVIVNVRKRYVLPQC